MWRSALIIFGGSILLTLSSCFRADQPDLPPALQRKSAPYDMFSFQRSYPDRDFDWRGWRRQLARLRAEAERTEQIPGISDRGAGADWTLQGPGNIAGRVNTLAVHPTDENTLLAGFSGGGMFKSTDGGVNWKPVFDDKLELAIGDITYDPVNPNIVYAGTGDPNIPAITFNGNGLYKSTDGGESWKYLGLEPTGIISKVLVDPSQPNTLFVGAMGNPYVRDENRGVYKSTDGGLSWKKVLFVSNQAGVSDLVMNPSNPQILYASFWDRIRNNQESVVYGPHAQVYKTIDGGATWTLLSGGLPSGIMGRTGLAISQQNPEKVYAVYMDSLSTPGGLFKSTDGGASWTSININALEDACADFGWYFAKIRLNPTNDEEVYFLAIVLWRKAAGSTQWQSVGNAHADIHDLHFTSSGRRYLACDGGIYRNLPNQSQWTKSNNLPTTQFYHTNFNPHEPNVYFGGAQDNGIKKGNAASYNTWASVFPADGFRCAFHPKDPKIFWVETQNGEIHKTIDGGQNWSFGTPCLGTTDRCNWDMPYILSTHQDERLYAGTYRVYYSDGGSGWGVISQDLTDGDIFGARFHNISCLDESPVIAEKLLAGTSDGNVWRREPAGNWTNITAGLPNRYVTSVVASPTLSNRIFVTHSGFRDNEYIPHIHRSDNNGQSWTDIGSTLPNVPVNDLLVLPGYADSVLFAATDAGVYLSRNGGKQWQRLGKAMPMIPVFDLERNPVRKELLAATHARGLWTFPLDSIFTLPPPVPVNTIAIAGAIKTESGQGIGQVTVCGSPWGTTDTSGAYQIQYNAPCLSTGVFPKRTDNPLNGVSTFDLVLINKHILGTESLNSPYKIIAADANNSRTITTFDIVTLRKLILGIDTVLANVDSWRFIPADYVFPNPAHPFGEIFPEGVKPALPAQPADHALLQDFVGLKVGDVNGNVVPLGGSQVGERSAGDWPLLVENQPFRAGEEVRMACSIGKTPVAGAQFTLVFDPELLELAGIEPIAPGTAPDHFALCPRGKPCLTACLEELPAVASPTVLFNAVFRAKKAGQLQSSVRLGLSPTRALAFDVEGMAYRPVLHWQQERPPSAPEVFPNPFGSEGVWLRQEMGETTPAVLQVFSADGRLIVRETLHATLHLPATLFPQKGVYWYALRRGRLLFSGKLVYTGN